MDPKFLLDALELLIQCRHMLKWTYVFGFFLDQKNSAFKARSLKKEKQKNCCMRAHFVCMFFFRS
jgi:hypothetical protein